MTSAQAGLMLEQRFKEDSRSTDPIDCLSCVNEDAYLQNTGLLSCVDFDPSSVIALDATWTGRGKYEPRDQDASEASLSDTRRQITTATVQSFNFFIGRPELHSWRLVLR